MKHHKFHTTIIKHHHDGSGTLHHQHEDGAKHDVEHAVGDHDAMIDSMMHHTGTPNPGEAAADAGDHGVAAPAAAAAGLPAPPAGA